jgi:streptogramin lyase
MSKLFARCFPAGATFFVAGAHLRLKLNGALLAISLASAAQAKTRAFPIPTGSQPISITLGPDGNLWFTLQNSSQVARITPEGVITEFQTPTFSFPIDITPGPDGNVWFSEGASGRIGFITPGGRITEIEFSNFDASSGIAAGSDGNIWFTDVTGNNIWRFDLTTRVLTKFPIPTPGAFPGDMTAGADGNLWFTEGIGKIGRITTSGVITEFGNDLGLPYSITDGPRRQRLVHSPIFSADRSDLAEWRLYIFPYSEQWGADYAGRRRYSLHHGIWRESHRANDDRGTGC